MRSHARPAGRKNISAMAGLACAIKPRLIRISWVFYIMIGEKKRLKASRGFASSLLGANRVSLQKGSGFGCGVLSDWRPKRKRRTQ